jgi:DNA-binding NarL/FixJ family response regulator
MLAQGMSNSEIARIHFVSEKSVEQMVGRIAHTFNISPQASSNMRVLLTLAFLTGLEEVVA